MAYNSSKSTKERTFRLEYKKGVEWKFFGFHSTPFKMAFYGLCILLIEHGLRIVSKR